MLHLTTSFYFDFPSPSRYNKNNLLRKEVNFIIGKKFNETLKFLGPEYSVKTVDKEPCVYLKLDKYDFEQG